MPGSSIWGWRIKGWFILLAVVLAVIIVPFVLFGAKIDAFVDGCSRSDMSFYAAVLLVGGLLAADIFLPVPSSIVSTLGGVFLGFIPGLVASAVGMTISCIAGYWMGAFAGRPAAARLIGNEQMEMMGRFHSKWGIMVVVFARPVPVLAEASVFFTGIAKLNFWQYMIYSTLSNIGVSAIYAAAGAYSAKLGSFLLSFVAAIILPGILMLRAMLIRRKPN